MALRRAGVDAPAGEAAAAAAGGGSGSGPDGGPDGAVRAGSGGAEAVVRPVRAALSAQPWRDVPAEEARWMRPQLPKVQTIMVEGVLRHVPEYARPGDAVYLRVVESAVAHAMEHFVQIIADPDTSWKEIYQVYFDVGYGEAVEGRSLENLQNAMRIGSRIAWRCLAVEYERQGRPMRMMSVMAEANFAYLDELTSAAANGYARAREKAAGEREQRRGRLLGLLLSDAAVPAEVVGEQAALAGWPLPQRLAVVVLRPRAGQGGEGPAGLPPEVLTGLDHGRPCLVMPDPAGPGQAERLAGMLAGWTGAVGPVVEPGQAGVSLQWARRTLELVEGGAVRAPEGPRGRAARPVRAAGPGAGGRGGGRAGMLVYAEEHLPSLLLHEGGALAEIVAARRLGPLSAARPKHGLRLAVTLLECLKNGFNATGAAASLHVHPQTVRYRLGQLHELLEFDFEDPQIRLELMLVLHVWIERARAGADAEDL
ncbi:PucR family transcriptional regulator [Actinomadura parmotrematis]|uniref:Helix-turn-helix domain-containing protein n=1 Tax=Actinomadura parmotrematis TaxID=2864039 RepID=A0ABS7FQQ9_9ACTN|nr:helix-turn-helix domain-containing protein [Actinomadura parmotrematis]MBW8482560.1 helix-turn-helix domain-containing protein [Actinomadura parmotrematis]